MGTKERREREREAIRDKILDAARELFVNEGYDAVTMRKIAQRIEYSPTAIYFHFKDKSEVMRELCDRDFAQLAQQLREIATLPDPVERLRATGRGYVQFALHFPNHYRLMFMTPRPECDEAESAIERGNPEEDAYAFLRATIDDCIAQGRFHREFTDADLLAQTMWAGMHGVVSLSIAKENDDWVDFRPAVERAELMSEALIRGLEVGLAAAAAAKEKAGRGAGRKATRART